MVIIIVFTVFITIASTNTMIKAAAATAIALSLVVASRRCRSFWPRFLLLSRFQYCPIRREERINVFLVIYRYGFETYRTVETFGCGRWELSQRLLNIDDIPCG